MPSTTRGSILISTANDIGEALVEKLGGVGYSPNEWKEKYNLCGIAPVDSAPALSVLADSAGTGDERGSILIATADAIGAILNKKYNVLRGFKPKEWASACRKMKALEEESVASASIASFDDGADDVPTKSLVVTISPTLSGFSSVSETQTGRNLLNYADITNSYRITSLTDNGGGSFTVVASGVGAYIDHVIKVKAGQIYSIKCTSATNDEGNATQIGAVNVYDGDNSDATLLLDGVSINFSAKTFTPTGNYILVRNKITGGLGAGTGTIVEPQLELGSTAHDYEPYTAPTTYTANLGRTIYGGTADIVKGTGTDGYGTITFDGSSDEYWRNYSAQNGFWIDIPTMQTGTNMQGISSAFDVGVEFSQFGIRLGSNSVYAYFCHMTDNIEGVTDLASWKTWLSNNPVTLVYPLATPTDFTFTGQEIPTRLGYNAFWSDCGDTAVEYYQAPTPYARKTATGGIANFSDQRTDLPLTKAIANIAPSIVGKSAVNLARAGKNLFDKENPNVVDGYITTTGFSTSNTSAKTVYIPIVGGATYTASKTAGQRFQIATAEVEPTNNAVFTNRQAGNTSTSLTITASANDKYLWAWIFLDGTDSGTLAEMLNSVQIEVGSTASAYVPYQDPTTYTAELGETVYGGSVDFVSGEVQKICGKITFDGSENWSTYTTGNGYAIPLTGMERGTWYTSPLALSYPLPKVPNNDSLGVRIGVNNDGIYVVQANTIEGVTDITSFKAYLSENPLTIIYPLATPTESAIPGRVISPIEGVNNYWNDAGGDTEIQYFENEA